MRLELEDYYMSDNKVYKLLDYYDLNKVLGITTLVLDTVYLNSKYNYIINLEDYEKYLNDENVIVHEVYEDDTITNDIWLNDLKEYFWRICDLEV